MRVREWNNVQIPSQQCKLQGFSQEEDFFMIDSKHGIKGCSRLCSDWGGNWMAEPASWLWVNAYGTPQFRWSSSWMDRSLTEDLTEVLPSSESYDMSPRLPRISWILQAIMGWIPPVRTICHNPLNSHHPYHHSGHTMQVESMSPVIITTLVRTLCEGWLCHIRWMPFNQPCNQLD